MISIRPKIRHLLPGVALVLGVAGTAAAEPSTLGRNLAATCANCHGTNGKAVGDGARLAGEPADKIIKTMMQFREDKKAATIMNQIAKGYTPEQIELIAQYLAAQK